MSKIKVGDKVPPFEFECTDPQIRSFHDLLGKNIVLYFYPKDNTPGCSLEGRDFKTLSETFKQLNTCVIGVSRDSLKSHASFCDKLGLPFPLISDHNEQLCKYFDVKYKNWFLSKIIGIQRTTFLIDTQGSIKHIWHNVQAREHAQAVLDYIKNTMN